MLANLMNHTSFLLFSVFSFVFSNKPTANILIVLLRKAPIKKTKENTQNKRKQGLFIKLGNLRKLNNFNYLFVCLTYLITLTLRNHHCKER